MAVWYTRSMRNWMRERMKRRKKKQEPNEAEATGKVGQQKPPVDEQHPEPIVPTYDDSPPESRDRSGDALAEAGPAQKMETEVQPEHPSVPPPGAPEQRPVQTGKTTRAPKGVVVLAIGLPGSGKTTWFK